MKHLTLAALLCAIVIVLTACGGQADTATTVAATEKPVDLDLSKLSGTVVYSQVYDMMADPEAYMGQVVRVKGNFNYFKDEGTGQEYFAVVIADATACCAQGMEFIWAGNHTYPADYPELDSVITVTGTFGTYMEDGFEYIRLDDATLV